MKDVLMTAHDLIRGERARHYGPPHDNFEVIADLWDAYLKPTVLEIMVKLTDTMCPGAVVTRDELSEFLTGVIVDGNDVCNLMTLLKIAREATGQGYHEDSTVDAAGYQGIKQVLQMPREEFIKEMKP